jgi:hypothetical protein
MEVRPRTRIAAGLLAGILLLAMAVPASATIHEMVASFCSGGNGNVFPAGQSDPTKSSFLRALQASGTVTVRPNTPTAGAITIDYNNDAPAGKFSGEDVFVEAIPGVWIEILDPDFAAFDHCAKFIFEE